METAAVGISQAAQACVWKVPQMGQATARICAKTAVGVYDQSESFLRMVEAIWLPVCASHAKLARERGFSLRSL